MLVMNLLDEARRWPGDWLVFCIWLTQVFPAYGWTTCPQDAGPASLVTEERGNRASPRSCGAVRRRERCRKLRRGCRAINQFLCTSLPLAYTPYTGNKSAAMHVSTEHCSRGQVRDSTSKPINPLMMKHISLLASLQCVVFLTRKRHMWLKVLGASISGLFWLLWACDHACMVVHADDVSIHQLLNCISVYLHGVLLHTIHEFIYQ